MAQGSRFSVRIRGTGEVEVAAHGPADAEHLVEKELARLWPEARVTVLEIARPDPRPRLVQDFVVRYRLDAQLQLECDSPREARAAAPGWARAKLQGSRYARTRWHFPSGG